MITPSFALTATERVLPRMALDFTTASLDSRVTFTRTGNTATVTNSSGVIVGINADLPRFDFDPTTLVCKGLLIEEARTNALLNSLIDGTDLATQLVTVTAAARTLSFYGTGTVVLSGAHSATVVGAGAYPTRTTLTFTPIAGVLTLTVTGTVQFAQLELGAFPTSYIPTEATAVTRNADVATMTGTNFSDWFNASEGAFAVWCSVPASAISFPALSVTDGTSAERIIINLLSNRNGTSFRVVDGTDQANISRSAPWSAGEQLVLVGAYKQDSFATAINASAVGTDTSGTLPTVDRLGFANSALNTPTSFGNMYIQKFMYWPQRLTNAEVQAFSK
jgi:hypothetical protein